LLALGYHLGKSAAVGGLHKTALKTRNYMQLIKIKENPEHRQILQKAAKERRLKHLPICKHIDTYDIIVVKCNRSHWGNP